MPNHEHYAGSSPAFPERYHGFASNPHTANTAARPSHPPQQQHPAGNQQQLHHAGSVYTPYQQPGNFGYANQSSQMPAAPADRRYAQHFEVASAGGQPQFPQTRYPETYPQYRYPAGNMQPAYATPYPPSIYGEYPQPTSTVPPVHRQQGYMNGTYPPTGTQSGHPPCPPQRHNSGQMPRVPDRPGTHSRNAADQQSQHQTYTAVDTTNAQVEPSQNSLPTTVPRRLPRYNEQQRDPSADNRSHQLKNSAKGSSVNHRQQNDPHIVKPAVLNAEAFGKLLNYLL